MEPLQIHSVSFRENESFLKSFSDGPKRDKGQLFLQIDLPDNPGAEDSIAEKIWRALHDSYFNCNSDDDYFCFEEALKRANEVIDQENTKRESGTIGRLNAVASVLKGDMLHFSHTGRAQIYLQRGPHISRISEDIDTDSDEAFSSILSGELAAHDRVIATSQSVSLGEEELVEVFSEKPSKIVSRLKSLAKKTEIAGMISFFTLPELPEPVVETSVEEEVEEVAPEEPTEERKARTPSRTTGSKGSSVGARLRDAHKKAMGALTEKLKSRKIQAAKESVSGALKGAAEKVGGIIKKPAAIKQVNRRNVLLTIIVLIVLFGGIMVLQSGYREQAQQAQQYEDLLSQARSQVTIAEQRFLIGEKTDATKFLNRASRALDEIEAAGLFQADVESLKNDIALYRDNFDAILRVDEPNVLVDLSTKGTVDALGMVHTQDEKNVVYEPRRVFETVLNKVQEPLTIDTDGTVIAGWELEDYNAIVLLTQEGEVIEYRMRDGRFENMKTQDETWKKAVDVKTFHGEFTYHLDPSSNTIWKYRRLRSSYSQASVYSNTGDLKNAISFAIDGDIFVLLRGGKVLKYRRGEVQPFEMRNHPTVPLKNPTRIFTFPEADNIYLLDSENKRVVVYSKGTGGISEYQKQVVFSSLEAGAIKDLSVDTSEQKLLVLTEDKIYITDL